MSIIQTVAAGLLTVLVLQTPVLPQEITRGTDTLIQLSREDADVREIITLIADAAGANIVLAPEVTGTVTLHLNNAPWRQALESAVRAARARIIEEDHGVLRIVPTGLTFLTAVRGQGPARGYRAPDRYTLTGPKNFLTGYPAVNPDGTVNVVVEIPTGQIEKWEVTKSDGAMRWEFRDRVPRKVQYLGYPGNYGMVPRTLLPAELGGDGDPLDVIVFGPAVSRGDILKVRIVGVLQLLDGGEQDDKLLAVMGGTPLAGVESIDQLQREFPGVVEIVKTWFANYKGPKVIEIRGLADAAEARSILETSAAAFERAHRLP